MLIVGLCSRLLPEAIEIKLLTPREVALMLNISEYTVRDYARRGIIPARKIGKMWRFAETDVAEWLKGSSLDSGFIVSGSNRGCCSADGSNVDDRETGLILRDAEHSQISHGAIQSMSGATGPVSADSGIDAASDNAVLRSYAGAEDHARLDRRRAAGKALDEIRRRTAPMSTDEVIEILRLTRRHSEPRGGSDE